MNQVEIEEFFEGPVVFLRLSLGGFDGDDHLADNWRGTESYPFWELDIVKQGVYEVTLMYVCSPEDVGSRVRVEVGDRHVDGIVSEAHDPDPIPSPDYVPRGEVYEKVWAPLTLGSLELPQGRTRLKVRALDLEGQEVMELKSVILRLEEPEVGR